MTNYHEVGKLLTYLGVFVALILCGSPALALVFAASLSLVHIANGKTIDVVLALLTVLELVALIVYGITLFNW